MQDHLAEQAKAGDREALAQLWARTEKLLYLKARSFFLHWGENVCAGHGVTLDDLQQECYFAFLDAVRAYDAGKGYAFNSYLNHASKNRFRACMGVQSTRRNPLDYADSLNATAGTDEDNDELGDMIEDGAAAAELEAVDDKDRAAFLHDLLERAMKRLPPMQETILRKRFVEGLSTRKTAEALHITMADVRREENKALIALYHSRPIREEWLEGAAYRGVGWVTFKELQGSVEERLVESRLYKRR